MSTLQSNIQKLEQAFGPLQPGAWQAEADKRNVNSSSRNHSQKVVIRILRELRSRGMTKKEFADRMGVTAQAVNKWMKGNANFTLETIEKMEDVLDINIVNIQMKSPVRFSMKPIRPLSQNYCTTVAVSADEASPLSKAS